MRFTSIFKLQPGTRVKYIRRSGAFVKNGETGTVIMINPITAFGVGTISVAVEWDEADDARHDCGGRGKVRHCWSVRKEDLEVI